VQSPTQRAFSGDDAIAAATIAFPDTTVTDVEQLTGGSFGTVFRVDLADGRRTALKVGPDPNARLLRYEAGMLVSEAQYLRLVERGAPEVPGPRLLYVSDDWLFMTLVPGTPMCDLPEEVDTAPARFATGASVARLHGVTGEFFGYPGERPRADNWPDAYAAMLRALLDDAVDWDVALPVEPEVLRGLVTKHSDVLATVTTPVLLHFDLWDGNVLTTVEDGRAQLTGLIDGERYLYGDPMIDFASPWLFRDMLAEDGHPFLAGYRSVRPLDIDAGVRIRYDFAQLYLYLLMVVEFPSRGKTPESQQWMWDLLTKLIREITDRLS
jgi:Ser/Thr protein kinase RdoA (MazF antagonist)